jgi:hypothetical protein
LNFPFGDIFGRTVEDENADPNALYLLGVRYKPIVLAPGQSINDLSLEEQIERGIDWEATAKASAMITGIRQEQNRNDR